MENKSGTTAIPAEVLEAFDDLAWEDTTEKVMAGFTVMGIDATPGSGCITLYGFYPLQGTQTYLIVMYADDDLGANAGFTFRLAKSGGMEGARNIQH